MNYNVSARNIKQQIKRDNLWNEKILVTIHLIEDYLETTQKKLF